MDFGASEGAVPAGTDESQLTEDGDPDRYIGDVGTIVMDADGDGAVDALDLNGDGVVDTLDLNGDGIVDPVDLDGDGVPEAVDFDRDGKLDPVDLDGDGQPDPVDLDGDGEPDLIPAGERALYASQKLFDGVQAQAAAEAEAQRVAAVAELDALQVRLADVEASVDDARQSLRLASAEAADAAEQLDFLTEVLESVTDERTLRSVNAYTLGGDDLAVLGASATTSEVLVARNYTNAVLTNDHGRVALTEDLVAAQRNTERAARGELRRAQRRFDDRVSARDFLLGVQAALEMQVAVHVAGSQLFVAGFTFPVGDPYMFIDSFGFPRMSGTSFAHWHEGADIMAPQGTPLYAVENGVIDNVGTGTLGGIKLYVVGDSGTEYYYAHLAGYAPGIANGTRVAAGDLVGFVGTTGNAQGGSPHLHFEIIPDGENSINPYPILAAAAQVERASRSGGVDYQEALDEVLSAAASGTPLVSGGPVWSDDDPALRPNRLGQYGPAAVQSVLARADELPDPVVVPPEPVSADGLAADDAPDDAASDAAEPVESGETGSVEPDAG